MIRAGNFYRTLNNFLFDNKERLDINQKECIINIIDRCLETPLIAIPQTKAIERISEIVLNNKDLIKNFKKELKNTPKIKYKRYSFKYQRCIKDILYTCHSRYTIIASAALNNQDKGKLKYHN